MAAGPRRWPAPSSARPSATTPADRRNARNDNGPVVHGRVARTTPSVAKCGTTTAYEDRVEGYRVTYEYNGRRQTTQLPYDPGDRIRVRVDVRPDDYEG